MAQAQIATEEDLQIDLIIHDFSALLIEEFIQKIVKPYFKGNMNEAVKSLMQKAISEETIVNQAIIQKTTKKR
jgi:hypothetical protein